MPRVTVEGIGKQTPFIPSLELDHVIIFLAWLETFTPQLEVLGIGHFYHRNSHWWMVSYAKSPVSSIVWFKGQITGNSHDLHGKIWLVKFPVSRFSLI